MIGVKREELSCVADYPFQDYVALYLSGVTREQRCASAG